MRSTKQNIEILEKMEGLTATSLQQQVQETQEAYFILERDLETALILMQEVVEVHEDEEDLSNAVARLKQFLDEQQL
jgi:hypothetical protein